MLIKFGRYVFTLFKDIWALFIDLVNVAKTGLEKYCKFDKVRSQI